MIKILNIISDTNIGGAGHATLNYLKAMDRTRFSACVVLPAGSLLKPRVEALDVPVIEIEAMADKSFDRAAISILRGVIEREDPDIVHTHGSLSGRIAGKKCEKTVIFTRHSAFPFPGYIRKTPLKLVYKYLYEHYSDRIIAISPAGAKILIDGGISTSIIDIMMNGCEPLKRSGADECEKLKAALGIAPGDFVLGIVARIEEYKGHLDILDALKLLRDREKPVKLIIAGTGGFEEAVKSRANELGLIKYVIFTGFISGVAPYMSVMDVQLNASYISETSSLSILEGMSIALPAIVSDCSGNPYVIDDEKSGLLFPPRDSKALSECVLRLMEDPALLKKLGEGAKQAYEERFTLDAYARNIENIYRKSLREKEVARHEQ